MSKARQSSLKLVVCLQKLYWFLLLFWVSSYSEHTQLRTGRAWPPVEGLLLMILKSTPTQQTLTQGLSNSCLRKRAFMMSKRDLFCRRWTWVWCFGGASRDPRWIKYSEIGGNRKLRVLHVCMSHNVEPFPRRWIQQFSRISLMMIIVQGNLTQSSQRSKQPTTS